MQPPPLLLMSREEMRCVLAQYVTTTQASMMCGLQPSHFKYWATKAGVTPDLLGGKEVWLYRDLEVVQFHRKNR